MDGENTAGFVNKNLTRYYLLCSGILFLWAFKFYTTIFHVWCKMYTHNYLITSEKMKYNFRYLVPCYIIKI